MKKIITKGEFLRQCKNCKTVFTYEFEDVEVYRDTDYTGSTDVYKVTRCPTCGERVLHRTS